MRFPSNQGFTLIELIVVIVLLGIMAAGAGLLISRPIEAYSDQQRRHQLVDSANMALRNIAVDIRRALPNSIRTQNTANGWALEMVNTVDGMRYRDEAGGGFTSADDRLDFSFADNLFNVLGSFTHLSIGNYPNHRVVVYNTSPAAIYSDAALNNNPGIISGAGVQIANTGTEQRITLTSPVRYALQSPTQRLFVVDGPVTYLCDTSSGDLVRYNGYAYQVNQSDVDSAAELAALGASTSSIVTQVGACAISYQAGSPQRGGLVSMDLTLSDNTGESVNLLHQVHVDNVP